MIPKPRGRAGIAAVYGEPLDYVDRKAAWEAKILDTVALRQGLPYAYGRGVLVVRVRAHRLVAKHLAETLEWCVAAGVPLKRLHYGGCYSWRAKRGGSTLSTHAWGIAVDLEPAANPLGKAWRDDGVMLHPKIVETFKGMGWTWGGDWTRPDAQHFQWCSGY